MSNSSSHLDETKRFWEERIGSSLSIEDVQEINSNLSGYFGLLKKWKDSDQQQTRSMGETDEK